MRSLLKVLVAEMDAEFPCIRVIEAFRVFDVSVRLSDLQTALHSSALRN